MPLPDRGPSSPIWWSADGESLRLLRVTIDHGTALGWTAEECLERGALEFLVHETDRSRLREALAHAARTLGTVDLECRAALEDGSQRRMRLVAAASRGPRGSSQFDGMLLELGEGHVDRERLLSEHARLQAILDGTRVGTWEWNCQTNETTFDERWAELVGYTLAELAPVNLDTWVRLTHPDDIPLARERLERHFRGETDHYECEFRMRHKDGRWVWVLDRGRVRTRDSEGRPILMFGTHTDISRSKRTEELLRQSASMLDGLARLQRECLIERDPRVTFERMLALLLETTQSAYGFIGEVHQRSDGQPYLKSYAITNIAWDDATRAFYAENAPKGMEFNNLDTLFGAVLTSGKAVLSNAPQRDPRRGGTPAGHPPLDAFLGLPLFRGTKLIGMIGIANRAGGYHEELVEQLEPVAATCSSLLHAYSLARQREQAQSHQRDLEAQLHQAQKLESLGLLAGGIAHDFNNLLTGMMGRAELALAGLRAGTLEHEHVSRALEAAERAAELVNQLLAYAGKARRGIVEVDLNALAEEMRRLLEVSMPRRCSLRTELTANLPRVHADPAQLRQVLMNLVINAGEATAERGDAVVIRTGLAEYGLEELRELDPSSPLEPGRYVNIDVEDNGSGMDRGTLVRIFEPFFTTKFTGRGLGLSAVLGIVRSHGGAIRCTSEPGVGTTFRVLLPCVAPGASSRSPAPVSPAGEDWENGALVLVADDDEFVRNVASKLLEELGCRVIVARDGIEALEREAEHSGQLALVLLDLTMPRLGGLEALRELRRRGSKARVVLTSGFDQEALAAQLPSRDVAGFLHKPYTRAEFRAVLRAARSTGPAA